MSSSKGEGLYFRDGSFHLYLKNLLVDCLGQQLDVQSFQKILPTNEKYLTEEFSESVVQFDRGKIRMLAIIILGIVALLVIIARVGSRNSNASNHSTTTSRTIRCPNCGSQATVKGDHRECGWCGDYGSLR